MRRVLTAVTSQLLSVVFCFLPAFGQQMSSPSRASVHRFGRLAAKTEASSTVGPIPAAATPAWTSAYQSTPHTGLDAPTAVYDPATNTMIVFGGTDAGLGREDTNAVLVLSNANGSGAWSTLIDNGAAGAPAARDGHTAVYDSANNRMIVFGGAVPNPCCTLLNDVWVLSGANGQSGAPAWTQLAPAGTAPVARDAHTAVYDAANNRMIIFGGGNFPQLFNEVWVLSNANGLGGTPAWTKLTPSGGPPNGLSSASAVYDPVNNIMTVFAGTNPPITADTNAVWTLSHANGLGGTPQWTNIVANGAAGSPARRQEHTAVYDVAHNRMIILGGLNLFSAVIFNDAWVLANANGLGGTPVWTKLNPTGTKPGVRYGHTAVYDAVNNLMIVLAGVNFDAQFYITWLLSDANGI